MGDFFQFEADFVDSLHCIPMQVRMKLDTCGVKLKLAHWHQLNQEERQVLIAMACRTPEESQAYRKFLQTLVTERTGGPASTLPVDPNPPWMDESNVPPNVREKAAEFEVTVRVEQWRKLMPLQRFALIKLSRPSHENRNFYPAIKEFGLV